MRDILRRSLATASKPAIAMALVVLSHLLFHQKQSQSPVWLAPYLSGAANWTFGGQWMVDPSSLDLVKSMDAAELWNHRFAPSEDPSSLVKFESMDAGWMWFLWAARHVLPFVGDLCAASVLTMSIHLALGWLVLRRIASPVAAGLFVLLYLANPLVVHVVSMPYYYGWQAVAALCATLMVMSPEARRPRHLTPLLLLSAFCVAVRPGTAPLVVAAALYAAYRERGAFQWIAAAILVSTVALTPKVNKPFWHTAYVGLGAYPNSQGIYLSDNCAHDRVTAATGQRMTFGIEGSFHDPSERRRYDRQLRDMTLEVVAHDPALPARNLALNSLIAFAWVYKPGLPYPVYLFQAVIGAAVLGFLVWHRQHKALLGIALTSGLIVVFYPPIAAYVAGSYVFLALGLAKAGGDALLSIK